MKFTTLLKRVIVENAGRIDHLIDIYTKNKKKQDGTVKKAKMSIKDLAALVAADPKSIMQDVNIETASAKDLEKVKAGKYTNWIIKNYLNLNQQI